MRGKVVVHGTRYGRSILLILLLTVLIAFTLPGGMPWWVYVAIGVLIAEASMETFRYEKEISD